ncbi:amino acid transporter (plasmid) [Deinococcus sp. KNUC1210]|uniref:amino acid transporter n=1 Tax=Deinococcus sp. KNUC1210 TaxID=2917691 RepID=UPI001EF06848|nr:amino acid transporter [Deinococcus sp. KNUC1210]ULH17080.1 amino acid transporter [Deinococcus sp. KNUC1210]
MTLPLPPSSKRSAFTRWLLEESSPSPRPEGYYEPEEQVKAHAHTHTWWQVMCLTGVDYFSTLGYQPGIAALAAGALSPFATLVLVLVTLFGALPMYRRVAQESPHGDGSISMLERLLSFWPSKLLVLALLGFVATGFVITITLSAADAAAHMTENPLLKAALEGRQVGITLALIALLGAVFLKGFKEAIGIAVVIVVAYLGLTTAVVVKSLTLVLAQPHLFSDWFAALGHAYTSPLALIGAALLVFPRLALGLSGFETGVVVMPLIKGDASDTEQAPAGRIRNGKKLLTTAALIMSVFLIASSVVTTLLIPAAAFQPGGAANGRALAYLAHTQLGEIFGTAYDVSTIAILWFAGASAMAGLLNIVPRYLPRYGMAPDWARAHRPLVLVFMGIAFLVTLAFRANVDAQAGAYATGVLALMTSAAVAVTLSAFRHKEKALGAAFTVISAVFIYTISVTVLEQPQGLYIALLFIAGVLTVSVTSRISRSTELRSERVELDAAAQAILGTAHLQPLRFIANHLDAGDVAEYRLKELDVAYATHLPAGDPIVFLEVRIDDASDFSDVVEAVGTRVESYNIIRITGSSVPNSLAAFLLHVRDLTGIPPHVYFEWDQDSPMRNALRFLIAGEGDIPPLTHEILRQAEPDRRRRPVVHVGG